MLRLPPPPPQPSPASVMPNPLPPVLTKDAYHYHTPIKDWSQIIQHSRDVLIKDHKKAVLFASFNDDRGGRCITYEFDLLPTEQKSQPLSQYLPEPITPTNMLRPHNNANNYAIKQRTLQRPPPTVQQLLVESLQEVILQASSNMNLFQMFSGANRF